jgi:glucan phosphoethanolaminetransferase (alkaline phosphatase superfamily)
VKLLIVVLLVLVVVFETIFFENIFDKIKFLYQTKSIYISAYYVLVSLVGFVSIALLFFLRQKRYFFLAMFLLFLTYAIELVYKDINSTGFGLNELSLALNEGDAFALDALKAYSSSIELALFILAFILVIVFFLRKLIVKKGIFIKKEEILFSFLLAVFLAYSITYKTTGATQTRPNLIKMVNTSIYYVSNRLYYGEREVLKEKATLDEKYKNIILIVDESIGGKYLSINGYEKETTPYLQSIKKQSVY